MQNERSSVGGRDCDVVALASVNGYETTIQSNSASGEIEANDGVANLATMLYT